MSEIQQIIEMSKYGKEQAEARAKRTLAGYMRMFVGWRGLTWDEDNQTEIEQVVEDIVTAASLNAVVMVLSQLELEK